MASRSPVARVFLLTALLAWAPATRAQTNDVFDQFFRYTEVAHRTFIDGVGDESVDPFSGNVHLAQTDLVLPGKAGLDLVLTRSYSSKIWVRSDGADQFPFIAYSEPPMLGWGWSFHMSRLKNPGATGADDGTPCSGNYPVLEMPDGSARVFYVENPSVAGVLVSRDRWRLQKNCTEAEGTQPAICIWSPDGVRREYTPDYAFTYRSPDSLGWPMTRMVDRFGNIIRVAYEPDRLATVSTIIDTYDRQITFHYTGTGYDKRLDSVTAGSNTYTYGYTTYSTIYGPTKLLTSVTPPSGPPFSYDYFGTSTPTAENRYALKSITYPYGGSVSYTYETRPFYTAVTDVGFPVVSTRTVGGTGVASGTWRYDYLAGSSGMNTTTVTRPDGRGGTTTDTYTMYGFGAVAGSPGSLWLVGLTESVSRAGGAETEQNTWQASPVVAVAPYSAPGYASCNNTTIADRTVVEPLLAKRVVKRNTGTYTTEYQDYDSYGQVLTLVETGPAGQGGSTSRKTTLTYFARPQDSAQKTLNMVKGFPLSRKVCIGSDCVTDSWTYSGPSNARDSMTLSGIRTTFGYHDADPEGRGNLKTVTNARNQTLTLSRYYSSADNQYGGGVPLTIDFGGALTLRRTTTWEGWLLSQTDGRMNTTTYEVDGIGRTVETVPPGGSDRTTIVYDQPAGGAWSSVSTRGSYVLTTTFDGLGRRVGTTDSLGVSTSVKYDVLGRQWFQSYPYASTEIGEKYDFDVLDRVTQLSKGCSQVSSPTATCSGADLSTEAYTYGAKNCVTTAAQRGPGTSDTLTTTRCFDAFGEPEQGRLTYLRNEASQVNWKYAYSTAGKLKSVTAPDSRGNRSYTFDGTQFMTGETLAELGTIPGSSLSARYTPNEIGQVRTRADARGFTWTYGYADPLSRLTSITYSNDAGNSFSQGYQTGSNNLSSVSSTNGGAFSYSSWDELDRLRAQTWTFGGSTYATSYVYDAHYCLTRITYPTGAVVTQTCDPLGRVKTISIDGTQLVTNVAYHPSSQPATVSYPGGRSTTYTFDTRARVKTATTAGFPGSVNVLALSYTYDGLDNVTTLSNVNGYSLRMCASGSGPCAGGYDEWNRLVSVIAPGRWGSAAFSYDVLGNRTFKTLDQPASSNTTYAYDGANRLSAATGGDVFTSMTLTWDAAGRLATTSDGASYKYDAQGRRVSKTVGGVTTAYHYDSAGRVIAETTSDGLLRNYVYLGGKLVAATGCLSQGVTACNEVEWYHTDALGSVLAQTDSAGSVVERFEYMPWGESWSVSDAGRASDRQYNGRVYDPGTGFHDYGARMYWPQIGRFISADSYQGDIANPASLNRYSYVQNNPYKYVDPTGHQVAEAEPAERMGEVLPQETIEQLCRENRIEAAQARVARRGGSTASLRAPGPLQEGEVEAWQTEAERLDPTPQARAPGGLKPETLRGVRSLLQRIAEHEAKLAEFKASPTVRPGMENQPPEVIERQQQARIRHLESEIRTFKDNIDKMMRNDLLDGFAPK